MLFVSRCIGFDRYGVVDTDDAKERIMIEYELRDIDSKYRLGVKGINAYGTTAIMPYQAEKSKFQLKTQMIKGISTTVYKSMLTSVRFKADAIKYPVTFRLSDFGTCCGDLIFSGLEHAGEHKVTVILDDKCDFTSYTFRLRSTDVSYVGVNGIGVLFDLTECSDTMAFKAYKALFGQNKPEMLSTVVDTPERSAKLPLYYYTR